MQLNEKINSAIKGAQSRETSGSWGKVLNIGKVKKQISSDGLQVLSGGADQVVLPTNWDLNTWVTKVVDKQTGLLYSYEEFLKAFPNLISK